jgi:hypothetical protein
MAEGPAIGELIVIGVVAQLIVPRASRPLARLRLQNQYFGGSRSKSSPGPLVNEADRADFHIIKSHWRGRESSLGDRRASNPKERFIRIQAFLRRKARTENT